MKFKLTAEEVTKIVNDITLNGSTNKEVVVSVDVPNDQSPCMELVVKGPIYGDEVQEIAKHFDDTNVMFNVTFDRNLAIYIVPGEKFFEEGGQP